MKFEAMLSPELEKLTGQRTDVVEVSDADVEKVKTSAIRYFTYKIILKYGEMYTTKHGYDALTKFEENELLEDFEAYADCGISDLDDLAVGIATGRLKSGVEESVQEIVERRVKFYTFNIHYEGDLSICLRAHCEDQAREYLGRMCRSDFDDYISAEDTEFNVNEAELDSVDDDGTWTVISAIDATDD